MSTQHPCNDSHIVGYPNIYPTTWNVFGKSKPNTNTGLYYEYFDSLNDYFRTLQERQINNIPYRESCQAYEDVTKKYLDNWNTSRDPELCRSIQQCASTCHRLLRNDHTSTIRELTVLLNLQLFPHQNHLQINRDDSVRNAIDARTLKEMLSHYMKYRTQETIAVSALELEVFKFMSVETLFHEKQISKCVCLFICSFPGYDATRPSTNWPSALRIALRWDYMRKQQAKVLEYCNFFDTIPTLPIRYRYNIFVNFQKKLLRPASEVQYYTYFSLLNEFLGLVYNYDNQKEDQASFKWREACDKAFNTYRDTCELSDSSKILTKCNKEYESDYTEVFESDHRDLSDAWKIISNDEHLHNTNRLDTLRSRYITYQQLSGYSHKNIETTALRWQDGVPLFHIHNKASSACHFLNAIRNTNPVQRFGYAMSKWTQILVASQRWRALKNTKEVMNYQVLDEP